MFFVLSKILDILLSPYSWGLALLAAAVPWRRRSLRKWKLRRGLGIAGLAILVFASTEFVAQGLAWHNEHLRPSTFRPDKTYDVVVLLGGVSDERVSATMKEIALNDNVERLTVTYRLLRDGRAKFAIVSGGTVESRLPEGYREANLLAKQLEDWGIAKDRIVVEDRARNTRENAVFSKEIIVQRQFRDVLMVTSAFHLERAAECFAAVEQPVDVLAVDHRAYASEFGRPGFLPRAQHLADTSAMLREAFGRVVYRVRGYGRDDR